MNAVLTTEGLAKLGEKALRRAAFLSEGMRPLLEDAAHDMVAQMQGRISSGALKPLSPEYAARRARAGFHGPPLDRTGQLKSSMVPSVGRLPNGWVLRLSFSGQHAGGLSNAALAAIAVHGTRGSQRHQMQVRALQKFLPKLAKNRAVHERLKSELSGAPARNFERLPSAWRRAWLSRIRERLNSL